MCQSSHAIEFTPLGGSHRSCSSDNPSTMRNMTGVRNTRASHKTRACISMMTSAFCAASSAHVNCGRIESRGAGQLAKSLDQCTDSRGDLEEQGTHPDPHSMELHGL